MSFSLQNASKCLELYSPLPSHLIAFIFFPIWFGSQSFENFEKLKLIKHSKFNLHDIKEIFLKKTSIKVRKYFAFPWDVITMGPYRYMCTSPRIAFHENPHSKEMGYDGVYLHTSIAKTQVIISIKIHAFNKVIIVHGC
jgi:hypothetical protein